MEKFLNMKLLIFIFCCISIINAYYCSYTAISLKGLNKFLKETECKYIFIKFTPRVYILKVPLFFNLSKFKSIKVTGAGVGITNFIIQNKEGGFKFISNKKNHIVEISNLSIHANEKNISYSIYFSQPYGGNQHKRNIIVKNIYIDSLNNNNKFFFKKAIDINGAWRPLIQNVFITGFFGPKAKKNTFSMETCFNLKNTYSPTILNSRCWSSKIGLNFVSSKIPGPEGIFVLFSKFVNTFIGINIDLKSIEPEGFIISNHINSLKYGIKIVNKKFLIIKNNLIYKNKHSKKYIYVFLKNVYNSIIKDNIFYCPVKKTDMNYTDIIFDHSYKVIFKNNMITHKIKLKYINTKDQNVK